MGNSFVNGNPMQKNSDGTFSVVASGVGNPPLIVAKFDATGQSANIGVTTLYTVPASQGGFYRIIPYAVVTQVATTSSVLPNIQVNFTDLETGAGEAYWISNSNNANTVGATNYGGSASQDATPAAFYCKGGSSITLQTVNYASVGATPMLYSIHVRVEYLGA